MWTPLRSLTLAALVLTAGIDLAYTQIVTERVQFAPSSSSATIQGTLKEHETRDYILGAKAGQTMSVQLTTRSNLYFNVLPPHSEQALYVGQTQADPHRWSGTLPTDGEYTIRVYAMGAARDGAKQHHFACAVSIK